MPIYAYKCSACGFAKDALQKMSDAPLTVCPACGASAFEKQVTAAGFQLKGSGWYVTDFREGSGKKAEAATAAPAASNGDAAAPARLPSPRKLPAPHPPRPPALRQPRPPPRAPETTPMLALRKWLFSGLLVIVPLFITLAVLKWIIDTLDQTLWVLPSVWQKWLYDNNVRGLGVLLTLAILLGVGAIASNFVGKRLLGWGDAVVRRIPVVRSIYSSVKQVSDTLFSENGNAFRTAVLVQWPREGVWTIAFVTGAPGSDVVEHLGGGDYLSVYVPTTPNPTGGYFVMLKRSDCIELKMSVDEALKYIVSMGVVVPGGPSSIANK